MNSLPCGTVIKDKEGQRWIILASKGNRTLEKIAGNFQVYETHDNGGRPFDVIVSFNRIFILINDEEEGKESQLILRLDDPFQIFIGKDPKVPEFDGNSILVRVKDNDYIYIGDEIYIFQTESPVLEYHSPVGNSDVPYPYAVTRDKVYLMVEKKTIDNHGLTGDPYDEYYSDKIKGTPFKYEILQGRNDSAATFLNIWKTATAPYRK